MKVSSSILAGLMLAATPVFADEPVAKPAAPDGQVDKPVCRRLVIVGSRLPGPRVCRTEAQWESNNRDQQDSVRKIQENRRTDPNGGG